MPRDKVKDILAVYRASKTDPQGSWTGLPKDQYDKPVQDADDL